MHETQRLPRGTDSLHFPLLLLPSPIIYRDASACLIPSVETHFVLFEWNTSPQWSHLEKTHWTKLWKGFCKAFPNQVRTLMRISLLILLLPIFPPLQPTPPPRALGCHCHSVAFTPQSTFLPLPFPLPPSQEAEKEAQRRKKPRVAFSLPDSPQKWSCCF